MSASLAIDDQLCRLVLEAEDRVRVELGVSRGEARAIVSRQSGVPTGTLENMRRHRLKGLRGAIRDRIAAWVVRRLEAERKRLDDELGVARRCMAQPCEDEVREACAALEEARKLISVLRTEAQSRNREG